MKSDLSLTAIFGPIVSFIKRFHTIIFFLVVSGGLSAAILIPPDITNQIVRPGVKKAKNQPSSSRRLNVAPSFRLLTDT